LIDQAIADPVSDTSRMNDRPSPERVDHLPLETLLTDATVQRLVAEGDPLLAGLRTTSTPRVFIISGPSGVGKDSVIEQLQVRIPDAQYVVTATTRERRNGEIDGVHYRFITTAEFLGRIEADDFLENAIVYDHHYGVPRSPVEAGLRNGQDVIIKVDVQGAATLRRRISNTVSIFLAPESMNELLRRLHARKTEEPAKLIKRFSTACEEVSRAGEFDYVVLNEAGKLDDAIDGIYDIITAVHHEVHPPMSIVR
jgi:guanylate kinase